MRQKVTAKDIWGIVYPPLMYVGVTYIVQMIVVMAIGAFLGANYGVEGLSETELENRIMDIYSSNIMLITGISAFATVPFGFMFMYFDVLNDKQKGIYKKYRGINISTYLLIIPLAISSMMMGNGLVSIVQSILPKDWLAVYDDTAGILYGCGIEIQIFASVIAAPIIEEVIFRGLIFKRIRRVSNATIAIVLSALFFGIFHWNVVQGIYAFVIGAILAYVYEKYKNIIAPIIVHMIANGISVWSTSLVTEEELQQTQNLVYSAEELISFGIMTVVMGVITFLFLYAIKRSVNAVEAEVNY